MRFAKLALIPIALVALSLGACSGEPPPDDPVAVDVADMLSGKPRADLPQLPPLDVAPGDGLPETLPDDLVWVTNNDDPPFASPDAVRGGTYRDYMSSFPLTLRRIGPDSNGSFAGVLRYNQFSLVSFHPETRRPIPSIATHWAYGEDGRTIYYRLDPDARWSDGVPVTAEDFVFTIHFMRSEAIVAPWYNNYYTERIRDVRQYGDHTLGIQGADAKPGSEMHTSYSIGPTPRHFHENEHKLAEGWVESTNWEVEPNTGPYQIADVKKGKSITLERVDNWWAGDRKYYANRFNPEKIRYTVIRDQATAFQHFAKGDLDTFDVTTPQYWHEKATGEDFDKGFIGKYWYYNQLPVPSGGMILNTATPLLANRDIRYGLAHSMNFDKVINTVLRGDYERMPTFQLGFGPYDNRSIKPREFNLQQAGTSFDAAGFTERDSTGIRTNADGQRLAMRVTYGSAHHTERLVVLKEEAKKAGVELNLQLLDRSAAFKQMLEKKHEIAWMQWNSSGLSPRYWEHFHTDNANKPQTNNLSNHSNPEMDELIMRYRASSDVEDRIEMAHRLEQMVHDSGVVIPTFQVPYVRESAWRWTRLPDNLGTETSGSLFNELALSSGTFSSGGLAWLEPDGRDTVMDARDDGEAYAPIEVINTDNRASTL